MDIFDLSGRKAIVVGGAGDLGFSILEGLLEAGAEAVAIDISESLNERIEVLNEKGLKAEKVFCNISQRDEVKDAFSESLKYLSGRVDILVNSAGIQRRCASEDFAVSDWDEVLAINLTAPFLFCQLAANIMIPQYLKGPEIRGKIINIASIQSVVGGLTIPAYTASKGGIAQLTKTLSNDWAAKGINTNAIAPGYMATQLNTALLNDETRSKEILNRIPQQRWGTGDDLKGIAIFLASKASDYLNGTIIPVDGGYLGR